MANSMFKFKIEPNLVVFGYNKYLLLLAFLLLFLFLHFALYFKSINCVFPNLY